MISATKFVVVLGVMAIMNTQVSAIPTFLLNICSLDEQQVMPCTCCKKTCWYDTVEMATEHFGNMPGELNEAETRFTIGIMRQCIKAKCTDVCTLSRF
ncbi:unnamed protein product [Caenorhabditis brenneri]